MTLGYWVGLNSLVRHKKNSKALSPEHSQSKNILFKYEKYSWDSNNHFNLAIERESFYFLFMIFLIEELYR